MTALYYRQCITGFQCVTVEGSRGWCWFSCGLARVNGRNSNNLFFLDASHVGSTNYPAMLWTSGWAHYSSERKSKHRWLNGIPMETSDHQCHQNVTSVQFQCRHPIRRHQCHQRPVPEPSNNRRWNVLKAFNGEDSSYHPHHWQAGKLRFGWSGRGSAGILWKSSVEIIQTLFWCERSNHPEINLKLPPRASRSGGCVQYWECGEWIRWQGAGDNCTHAQTQTLTQAHTYRIAHSALEITYTYIATYTLNTHTEYNEKPQTLT